MRTFIPTLAAVSVFIPCMGAPAGEGNVGVPQDVLAQMAQSVGDWNVEGDVGGNSVKATCQTRWAPGRHMLISDMTWSGPDGVGVGTAILGWDVAAKEIVTSEFWTTGWSHHRRYKVVSANVWESTRCVGVTGEGKRIDGTARIERKGPKHMIWTLKSQFDGEPQPTVKLHFRRK